MASSDGETFHDFPPFFKVYKDGRVERYAFIGDVFKTVSPGLDPITRVQSKDVVISAESGVKARIFTPETNGGPDQKLPLLVHYHGGGFCVGSALDGITQGFLTFLVTQAKIMAISVEYRLAPEHPLPIAYDDSWAGLKWIASHSNGLGPEPWINQHVDFGRVFLTGESAGANLAHYVAVQAGQTELDGLKIVGAIIVHPFFVLGKEPDKMIKYLYPTSTADGDDPKLNPAVDPNVKDMVCDRVLVCVAEKDWLKNRGVAYYETLGKNEWSGKVEFYESLGEDHCFHMFNSENKNAVTLMKKMADFIVKQE